MGVKGNVGSDIALVANFSVWKTSGIWVMYAGGSTERAHSEARNLFVVFKSTRGYIKMCRDQTIELY